MEREQPRWRQPRPTVCGRRSERVLWSEAESRHADGHPDGPVLAAGPGGRAWRTGRRATHESWPRLRPTLGKETVECSRRRWQAIGGRGRKQAVAFERAGDE